MPFAAAAFLLFLVWAGSTCLSYASESPRTNENQHAETKPDRTADFLDPLASALRQLNQEITQEHQGRGNYKPDRWCEGFTPNTWSNWALAIFAAIGAVFALVTLERLREEIGETKRTADATVDASTTAKRQMFLSLRARLGLREITARNFEPNNSDVVLILHFENFGGKGAFIERVTYSITTKRLPEVPPTPDNEMLVETPIERGDVWKLNAFKTDPISDDLWCRINDEREGATRLTVWGVVYYKAGFGTRTRTLKFRQQYNPQGSRVFGEPTFGTVGGKAYNYAE